MKFRSKFNHGFTNRGCLHCAIIYAYKARYVQFFLQNVQNKVFKILKTLNRISTLPEQLVQLTDNKKQTKTSQS